MIWLRRFFPGKNARVRDAMIVESEQSLTSFLWKPKKGKLPCLIDYSRDFSCQDDVRSSFLLHIPCTDEALNLEKKLTDNELSGAGICASKDGWLLLQKGQRSFFYSPLSGKIIKLPEMDINFNRATFSSAPTSSDCLCFVIQSSKDSNKIRISMCSPGDKEWFTKQVKGFNSAIEDVLYSKGKFYCLFGGGVLGAFRVQDRSWHLITKTWEHFSAWSRAHLLKCNGELLLVCQSQSFYIFGFDHSGKVWKRKNTVGNQALFLGCTAFSMPAKGAESHMADRIYYNDNVSTCYYSLKTQQRHRYPVDYPWIIKPSHERVWIQWNPRSWLPRIELNLARMCLLCNPLYH